jgi:hypothetical protein
MAVNLNWLGEYLAKTGQKQIADLFTNSPEAKPEEVDLDKAASDYKDGIISIFKSSDQFKGMVKDARIVALKEFKKELNDSLQLGLSAEEAGTIDPKEFIDAKLKAKFQADIEAARNGKSSEWQKKYEDLSGEFNTFKKKYDGYLGEWQKKYEEEKNANAKREAEAKRESIWNQAFEAQKWGDDPAHKENSKIVLKSLFNQDDIKWKEDGSVYRGENDAVTAKDGFTILKNIEQVIQSYGQERKLFPQANAGGGTGASPVIKPTGDPDKDALIQTASQRLAEMNAGNF